MGPDARVVALQLGCAAKQTLEGQQVGLPCGVQHNPFSPHPPNGRGLQSVNRHLHRAIIPDAAARSAPEFRLHSYCTLYSSPRLQIEEKEVPGRACDMGDVLQ